MVGGVEIAIVLVFLLLLFGYKYLPALGRSAGKGARELKDSVSGMVGEHDVSSESLGRSAGKGVREVREFKDALKGSAAAEPKPKPAATGGAREEQAAPPAPSANASSDGATTAGDSDAA